MAAFVALRLEPRYAAAGDAHARAVTALAAALARAAAPAAGREAEAGAALAARRARKWHRRPLRACRPPRPPPPPRLPAAGAASGAHCPPFCYPWDDFSCLAPADEGGDAAAEAGASRVLLPCEDRWRLRRKVLPASPCLAALQGPRPDPGPPGYTGDAEGAWEPALTHHPRPLQQRYHECVAPAHARLAPAVRLAVARRLRGPEGVELVARCLHVWDGRAAPCLLVVTDWHLLILYGSVAHEGAMGEALEGAGHGAGGEELTGHVEVPLAMLLEVVLPCLTPTLTPRMYESGRTPQEEGGGIPP